MRNLPVRRLLLPLLLVLVARPGWSQDLALEFPEGSVQHVVRADEIPWGPCPDSLPAGCEVALLEGDLTSDGYFTARFRVAGEQPFVLPAHWHPRDERVTVLSGKVAVAFGADATRAEAREFGAGDYYVNARQQMHWVWIEGPTVLQISGLGPWKAVPLERGLVTD